MSLVPRLDRCVLVVFSALSITVPVFAGETKPKDREPSAASQTAVLKERDRRRLHPGDPLAIVGNEQEGNDIRSRTPALARSDRFNACVDADENHRRTLAMYASGESFPTALPVGPEVEARTHALRPGRGSADGPGRERAVSETHSAWPWVLGVGAALLVGMWALGGPPKPQPRPPEQLPAS
jgi:hypothetical protein